MDLLAKSVDDFAGAEYKASLFFHIRCTFYAAKAILDHLGENLLRFIGVNPKQWNRFRLIVLWAALLHDLGKANTHFLGQLEEKMLPGQSVRHEAVLYFLLHLSPLGEWVHREMGNETDFTYLVWAITGHHRKGRGSLTHESSGMKLLVNTAEFQEILDWIASKVNSSPAPVCFDSSKNIQQTADLSNITGILKKNGNLIQKEIEKLDLQKVEITEEDWSLTELSEQAFMAAVRSILMDADALASAIAEFESITEEDETEQVINGRFPKLSFLFRYFFDGTKIIQFTQF